MAWPKGKLKAKTGGRVKGSKNKDTTALINLYDAFREVITDMGGKEYVAKFAKEYPREFMAAAVKLTGIFNARLEVSGPNGGPIPTRIEVALIGSTRTDNQS